MEWTAIIRIDGYEFVATESGLLLHPQDAYRCDDDWLVALLTVIELLPEIEKDVLMLGPRYIRFPDGRIETLPLYFDLHVHP